MLTKCKERDSQMGEGNVGESSQSQTIYNLFINGYCIIVNSYQLLFRLNTDIYIYIYIIYYKLLTTIIVYKKYYKIVCNSNDFY